MSSEIDRRDTLRQRHVYFILAEGIRAVKIGIAYDASARLRELQVGSPAKLRLLGTIPGTGRTEQELHQQYIALWLHGEWFRLEGELDNFLKATFPLDSNYNQTTFNSSRIQDACPSDFLLNVGPTRDNGNWQKQKFIEFLTDLCQHLCGRIREVELADGLGMPIEHFAALRKRKKVKYFRLGRHALFTLQTVIQMVEDGHIPIPKGWPYERTTD